MIKLWRGCANAWECDELGHLNVRFYLAKAWEAVGDFADRVGMPHAFESGATSTLQATDITIRYLAEVRPGAPLCISGGVLDIGDDNVDIVLRLDHAASGRIAAIFRMTLGHAVPGSRRTFPWPQRIRDALECLRTDPPDDMKTRSLSAHAPASGIRIADADRLGLTEIGRGRINPEDCDTYGVMMPEHLQGKVSNSVTNFAGGFPEQFADHAAGGGKVGGALLEGRIAIRRWPSAGQGYVIRTGLRAADRNVRTLVHWVFDRRGRLMWSMEGVAAIMDLKARKLVKASDETFQFLSSQVRPDLTI
ncbi:thioesterase family protein [Hyphobacterium sp.]|uniref:thioesterase family protein n=1 Tax=Hyphobacterium sp. TaxID=2004662 RepID=UPI003BA88441